MAANGPQAMPSMAPTTAPVPLPVDLPLRMASLRILITPSARGLLATEMPTVSPVRMGAKVGAVAHEQSMVNAIAAPIAYLPKTILAVPLPRTVADAH